MEKIKKFTEGFSRNTFKDKNQFYTIALGSTMELQSQLLIAKDLKYIENKEFNEIVEKSVLMHKLINGLIKGNNFKMKNRNREMK